LEDEPDLSIPYGRATALPQSGNLASIQQVVAGVRSLQQPQEVHEGGLARTRTAANGDKLALHHRQGNVRYRVYDRPTKDVLLAKVFGRY
jgi:hypothetical protein